MWQELSISYAINSPKTEELAADLFYAIAKRDYILSFGVDIQNFEKNPKKAEKQSSTLLKTFGGDVSVKKKDKINSSEMQHHSARTSNDGDKNSISEKTGQRNGSESVTNAAQAQAIALEKNNKEIDKIKGCLIATIIMEKTRNLKNEDKNSLKALCDKVLF